MSVPIEEILNLSIKKRLELIEEIWDSIASNPGSRSAHICTRQGIGPAQA